MLTRRVGVCWSFIWSWQYMAAGRNGHLGQVVRSHAGLGYEAASAPAPILNLDTVVEPVSGKTNRPLNALPVPVPAHLVCSVWLISVFLQIFFSFSLINSWGLFLLVVFYLINLKLTFSIKCFVVQISFYPRYQKFIYNIYSCFFIFFIFDTIFKSVLRHKYLLIQDIKNLFTKFISILRIKISCIYVALL